MKKSSMYTAARNADMKRLEKVPALIKGSIATPSLVAGIMNAKYVNGMPLARQEREFARYNLKLSTKNHGKLDGQLCRPISETALRPDEKKNRKSCTFTAMRHGFRIDEPKQQGSTQNWMWVYLTDRYSEAPQMVLFDYERTRAGYHPKTFWEINSKDTSRDGYQAYHGLKDSIVVSGCFTHARRRYDAAYGTEKGFYQRTVKVEPCVSGDVLIGILYKIEELIQDKTPEERHLER